MDLPSDVPLVCKHCDAVGDTSYDSRSIPTDSRKAMIQSGDPVPPEFLLTRYDMRAAYEQCLAIHNAIAQKWQVGGTVAPEASKSAAVKEAIANISQVMEMTSKPKTVSSRRPKIDLNSIPPDCLFARRYAMHPLMHMYQPYEHKQAGELDFDTHSAIQAAIASITSIQEAYALLDDYPAPWVLDVVLCSCQTPKKNSFTDLRCQKMPLVAIDSVSRQRQVSIEYADKKSFKQAFDGKSLVCPECGDTLIPRYRDNFIPHFVHKSREDKEKCQYGKGETLRHLIGKAFLYQQLQRDYPNALVALEYRFENINRRADVAAFLDDGTTVIAECQISRVSPEDLEQRTSDYVSIGATVIWAFSPAAATETCRRYIKNSRITGFEIQVMPIDRGREFLAAS